MKKLAKAVVLLFIATIIFLSVVLANTFYWATNSNFYEYEQVHNDVSSQAGLPQDQINIINNKIIDYLTLRTNDLQLKVIRNNQGVYVFNDKELQHMKDVRILFIYGYIALGVSVLLLSILLIKIILKRAEHSLRKVTVFTPLLLIILSAVGIGIVLIDFNYWFTLFHKISFTNELWLLDPNKDTLIQIMPLDFFSSMFTRIIITSVASLFVFMIVGLIGSNFMRKHQYN